MSRAHILADPDDLVEDSSSMVEPTHPGSAYALWTGWVSWPPMRFE
jgi:hypothetical protein